MTEKLLTTGEKDLGDSPASDRGTLMQKADKREEILMNMLKSKTAEVETAYKEAKETQNEMEKLIRQEKQKVGIIKKPQKWDDSCDPEAFLTVFEHTCSSQVSFMQDVHDSFTSLLRNDDSNPSQQTPLLN